MVLAGALLAVIPQLAAAGVFPTAIPINSVTELQAFRGELNGEPAQYAFHLAAQQPVYLNLLIPDTKGARKDFLVEVLSERGARYAMNGAFFSAWVPFRDTNDTAYLQGPEIVPTLYSGTYTLSVSNTDNHGTYVLVIGDHPGFPGKTQGAGAALFMLRAKPIAIGVAALAVVAGIFVRIRRNRRPREE